MRRWFLAAIGLALCACPRMENARKDSGIDAGIPSTSDRDPTGGTFTLQEALAPMTYTSTVTLVAVIETGEGTIVARLFADRAPKTVANFVGLARGTRPSRDPLTNVWVKKAFYDGLVFHRLIPEFVIQGGDPLGDGTGGPGYKIEDEIREDSAESRFDRPGLLAMAKPPEPNTAGSQFFITEVPLPHLDGKHTIFGEVIDGFEVVKKAARAGSPVPIKRIAVETR